MLRCTYRRLRRHMICPTDWPRPLWLRPLWLRPLWPRPLWLRPLWLRPLWPRPLWPFPQAPLAQAQTAGPFVSGPFGPGPFDSQRFFYLKMTQFFDNFESELDYNSLKKSYMNNHIKFLSFWWKIWKKHANLVKNQLPTLPGYLPLGTWD